MALGKGASTSQPMTKSSSSSSASNSAEAKDATGTGPSPYGTRSRNRNGRARPNYAEDKDLDMIDFEMYPERKDDGDLKKSTRPANAPSVPSDAPPRSAAASSTRKPLPTTDNGKSAASMKEQHQNNQAGTTAPSSSATSSAAPTQPASKKRKAGTQTASASKDAQSSAPSTKTSLSSSVLKKPFGPATTGYAETNMMSFDDCKALPQNNTLTADDGTTLTVNGKQPNLTCAVHSALVFYSTWCSTSCANELIQILPTWSVSHLVSHITLAGLWSSSTRTMTLPSLSTL